MLDLVKPPREPLVPELREEGERVASETRWTMSNAFVWSRGRCERVHHAVADLQLDPEDPAELGAVRLVERDVAARRS